MIVLYFFFCVCSILTCLLLELEGNLKYKGCQCIGPNACMDNNCLCQRSNRECDPEACLICDARLVKVLYSTVMYIEFHEGVSKES